MLAFASPLRAVPIIEQSREAVGDVISSAPGQLVVRLNMQNSPSDQGKVLRFTVTPTTELRDPVQGMTTSAIPQGTTVTVRYFPRSLSAVSITILSPPIATPPPPNATQNTGGFVFEEVRVQAVRQKGAPAVAQVKSGVPFYVYAYVTVHNPRGETYVGTFAVKFGAEKPAPAYRDSLQVPDGPNGRATLTFDTRLSADIDPPVQRKLVTIVARVTGNGITQSRTTSFTIVR